MDEKDLDRHLVEHERQVISIAQIDTDSQILQNREHWETPVDTLDDYAASYERGDDIPPPIVWPKPLSEGVYVPIDGYGRTGAAKQAGRTELEVVVAHCDEQKARQLAMEANTTHGRQASRPYRLQSAMDLISQGYTVKGAAAAMRLPDKEVGDRNRLEEVRRRARKLNIPRIDGIRDTVLQALHSVKMDEPFRQSLELARDAEFTTNQARELAKEVNQAASEEDQIRLIDGHRGEYARQQPDDVTQQIRQPFTRFERDLTKLRGHDVSTVVKAALQGAITYEAMTDVVTRLRETTRSLEIAIADIYGQR